MKKSAQRRRGQIIPKGERKWLVRVYLGRDAGIRKFSSQTVAGTYKQAEQKLNEMLRGVDTSTFVSPSKQTVKEFLSAWIEHKNDLGDKAKREYTYWLEKHIIPKLGLVKLGALSKLHIQKFYGSLLSDHHFSVSTMQYIHAVLRQALDVAVQDQLIGKNPATGAQSSIPREERGRPKQVFQALTFEQTNTLLECTLSDRWHALWRLLLTTGLRPQEALALKWTDIEKKGEFTWLTVNRALVETIDARGKEVYEPREFHTKTDGSRRLLVLSEETAQALIKFKARQAEEMLKAGPRFKRQGWMFAVSTGSFLHPQNARQAWKKMLKQYGFPDCRLYDTRHTHLTHLLSSGINAKAVAARSGHSNPVVLLNTYAHVLPEVQIESANIVERMLADARVTTQRNLERDQKAMEG
jgi:integrase